MHAVFIRTTNRAVIAVRASSQHTAEKRWKITWFQGLILIIINTCLELGVFDAVSPDAPASADAIAAKVGIDASILCKLSELPLTPHLQSSVITLLCLLKQVLIHDPAPCQPASSAP
jgi:hypothetical protein